MDQHATTTFLIHFTRLLVDETEDCNYTVSCQGNHTTNDKFCDRIEGQPLVLRALVTTKSWPGKICKKVLGLQDPPCSQTLYVATAFDILPSLYSWRRFLSYFNCEPYYQNQIEASRGSKPLTICKCQWIPRCDNSSPWSIEEQQITSIQELLGFYQAFFYREKMHYLLESDPGIWS